MLTSVLQDSIVSRDQVNNLQEQIHIKLAQRSTENVHKDSIVQKKLKALSRVLWELIILMRVKLMLLSALPVLQVNIVMR